MNSVVFSLCFKGISDSVEEPGVVGGNFWRRLISKSDGGVVVIIGGHELRPLNTRTICSKATFECKNYQFELVIAVAFWGRHALP